MNHSTNIDCRYLGYFCGKEWSSVEINALVSHKIIYVSCHKVHYYTGISCLSHWSTVCSYYCFFIIIFRVSWQVLFVVILFEVFQHM